MVATLDELDEAALMSILTEPKNALTKQYRKLFEMEGAELEFREEALRAVSRKAMQRKTGARGLRTILETVLLDTMYDLPSLRNVSKVVVDDSVIEGTTKPYIVYRADEGRVAAVEEPRRAAVRCTAESCPRGRPAGRRPQLDPWRCGFRAQPLKSGLIAPMCPVSSCTATSASRGTESNRD